MAGLLYKDFVSIKGKKICIVIIGFILVFATLRFISFKYAGALDLYMQNEDGEKINLGSAVLTSFTLCFLILAVSMAGQMAAKIAQDDKKNKIMNYVKSMPLDSKTYYAEKYVFMMIMFYVLISAYFIISIINKAFCEEGLLLDLANAIDAFAPMLISVAVIFTSIELPLFIKKGKEEAMLITVAIWTVIAMILIAYFMFGDLTFFEKMDTKVIVDFVKKHSDAIVIIQVLLPAIAAGLFWLSYKITEKDNRQEAE